MAYKQQVVDNLLGLISIPEVGKNERYMLAAALLESLGFVAHELRVVPNLGLRGDQYEGAKANLIAVMQNNDDVPDLAKAYMTFNQYSWNKQFHNVYQLAQHSLINRPQPGIPVADEQLAAEVEPDDAVGWVDELVPPQAPRGGWIVEPGRRVDFDRAQQEPGANAIGGYGDPGPVRAGLRNPAFDAARALRDAQLHVAAQAQVQQWDDIDPDNE